MPPDYVPKPFHCDVAHLDGTWRAEADPVHGQVTEGPGAGRLDAGAHHRRMPVWPSE